MSPSLMELALPAPLVALVVLAVMAALVFTLRARGRRERRSQRGDRARLARTFARFVAGDLAPDALMRAAEAADAGACWTVLESLALRLDRQAWLRLSTALGPSRHAAAERRALTDDSPWRRVLAARRLALLRSRASQRVLRRAMTRGPEVVTLAAATALARYRDRGALRWILAHPEALAHRHRAALTGLFRAFGPPGLEVIAERLAQDVPSATFALAMMDTLGAGRCRGARQVLEERLVRGDVEMRTAAARALGLLQAIECGTTLIAALRDDAWPVRAQAARALGRVRTPLATHALAARLTDPSWWVRRHAAYALMEMGEDGQAALRHAADASPDRYARDMAREALDGGIQRRSA